jgi:hypothetical protein
MGAKRAGHSQPDSQTIEALEHFTNPLLNIYMFFS